MKPYIQEFLTSVSSKSEGEYNYDAMTFDANGDPTRIDYKRLDNTLLERVMISNPDSYGFYRTFVETMYAEDGITILKTRTVTMTYNTKGVGIKRETVVS